MRRFVPLLALSAVMLAPAVGLGGPGTAVAASGAAPAEGDYTFVSMPDTFNNDLGDASVAPGWTPGSPNSMNPAYRRAIATVFDDVAGLAPDALLVPGDTVEGHWGIDTAGTGIFGPVRTPRQQREAVRRAADLYYTEYQQMWGSRGVPLYPSLGDHEIGDNPWKASLGGYEAFKHDNIGLFKAQWAKHFTDSGTRFGRHPVGTAFDRTAYADQLSPELLLVTLDVFRKTRSGVRIDIGSEQLRWLRGELRAADRRGVDWIVVQAHTPILGPVRKESSSGLMYEDGKQSALWRTMVDFDVDLYLAGEVHANTVTYPRRGPVQIAHGGLFRKADATAMEGVVSGTRMDLRMLTWRGDLVTQPEGQTIWQTDTRKNIEQDVVYEPGPVEIGSLSLTRGGRVLAKAGVFAEPPPR